MKRIIILTGSELRHEFVRKYLASRSGIDVVGSYCEGDQTSLFRKVQDDQAVKDMRLRHLAARQQSEVDFFSVFVDGCTDYSNPICLPKGEVNKPEFFQAIIDARPDLLVAYGCSIIREPLLSAFEGRFVNVHLGLSPYYRGGGTNYWPLVNAEPEYVGLTFMHIDAGVDTGRIIHQVRAKYNWGDTPSQIGNRLIVSMAKVYGQLIEGFDCLDEMAQLPIPVQEKVCRAKDFSEESVKTLYQNFRYGLIEQYLGEESERCAQVPIIVNSALETDIL